MDRQVRGRHERAGRARGRPVERRLLLELVEHVERPEQRDGGHAASSPNSASCERVFALLRNLFGELQMKSLADYVQAALMLNYNQRNVG